jgi:chemotaxis protein CheX
MDAPMIDDTMIVQYVNTAAAEVFSTMLGLDLAPGPTRIESHGPTMSDGVFAFIGLTGEWNGSGAISCSSAFACRISSQLLGSESSFVNEEVLDAIGEVTNMIIGNFKTLAEEHVGPLGLSIPTVIFGHNFVSRTKGRNSWVVMPFQSEDSTLEVRLRLAPATESASHGELARMGVLE